MNGLTTTLLSQILVLWNWIFGEDAKYVQLDGKTLLTFTVRIYCFSVIFYTVVVGSLLMLLLSNKKTPSVRPTLIVLSANF